MEFKNFKEYIAENNVTNDDIAKRLDAIDQTITSTLKLRNVGGKEYTPKDFEEMIVYQRSLKKIGDDKGTLDIEALEKNTIYMQVIKTASRIFGDVISTLVKNSIEIKQIIKKKEASKHEAYSQEAKKFIEKEISNLSKSDSEILEDLSDAEKDAKKLKILVDSMRDPFKKKEAQKVLNNTEDKIKTLKNTLLRSK
jgi:hypothetical protein